MIAAKSAAIASKFFPMGVVCLFPAWVMQYGWAMRFSLTYMKTVHTKRYGNEKRTALSRSLWFVEKLLGVRGQPLEALLKFGGAKRIAPRGKNGYASRRAANAQKHGSFLAAPLAKESHAELVLAIFSAVQNERGHPRSFSMLRVIPSFPGPRPFRPQV